MTIFPTEMPPCEFKAIALWLAFVAMLCIAVGALGLSCAMIGKPKLEWPSQEWIDRGRGIEVQGINQWKPEPTTKP